MNENHHAVDSKRVRRQRTCSIGKIRKGEGTIEVPIGLKEEFIKERSED